MGQAKLRGNFEERKQQSIDRKEAARLQREREEAEWWASLTDEQKETVRKNRAARAKRMESLSMWMGMAYGLGGRYW